MYRGFACRHGTVNPANRVSSHEREMRRGQGLARIYELALFDQNGSRVTMQDLAGDKRIDLHFGSDRLGELYLLSKANGKTWRVTGTRRNN
jgi:hypothetical protein